MIEQLRAALEAATRELHERREALTTAHRAIDDAGEDADLDTLRTAFDTAASAFDEAQAELERCSKNVRDEERRQRAIEDNPIPADPRIRVGNEPLTYSEQSGHSFFSDAYRMHAQADPVARERLERHGRENLEQMRENGIQLRDVGTGAFAGLTVPQYLIDLFAPLARAGSPVYNAIARKLPLPEKGMTLNVSRITTGTAVAAQANENDAVQETNIDDTLLTVNVRTYAGQQDVARQALERSEMVDAVVFQDLVADYFTKIDSAILNADGTSGTHLGIRSTSGIIAVTYTDATPTVAEGYAKEADAIQQINTQLGRPASAIVMHPRRWGWNTAALDSQNRPLVVPNANGPFNAVAVGEAAEYGQVVGSKHGLPVITDANIPTNLGTNEDVELILRMVELLFWQEGDGSPRQLRFEQSNAPQSVRLAVWGYSAFTAGRYPTACATIGGTGYIAPTF